MFVFKKEVYFFKLVFLLVIWDSFFKSFGFDFVFLIFKFFLKWIFFGILENNLLIVWMLIVCNIFFLFFFVIGR